MKTVQGTNLTAAAHEVGFADLVNFCQTYRRSFVTAAALPWGQ